MGDLTSLTLPTGPVLNLPGDKLPVRRIEVMLIDYSATHALPLDLR